MDALTGTITFAHGNLQVKGDSVHKYVERTLRIILREQVNGFALTLLNKILPTISVTPTFTDRVRQSAAPRLVDILSPFSKLTNRMAPARGLILSETASQLLDTSDGRALLGFATILYAATGPAMLAVQMRDAIVKAQPSTQFRTAWKDLVPTVEALVIPQLVSEIRRDINETAERLSTTYPCLAVGNEQSATCYSNIKEACSSISKTRDGCATYVSLDYSSAVLLSVLLQNMTATRVVFVETEPSPQQLVNTGAIVYIAVDTQFSGIVPLPHQYLLKSGPDGLGAYLNGVTRVPDTALKRAAIRSLARCPTRDDVTALALVGRAARFKPDTVIGNFLSSAIALLLTDLLVDLNQPVDPVSISAYVESLRGTGDDDRARLFGTLFPYLSVDEIKGSLEIAETNNYLVEFGIDPDADPYEEADPNSTTYNRHNSVVFAFIAIVLVSRFVDLHDIGLWAATSAWGRVGSEVCLWFIDRSSSPSGPDQLIAALLGEHSVSMVHHLMSANGVVVTSKLLFGSCDLGRSIFEASPGYCVWNDQQVSFFDSYPSVDEGEDDDLRDTEDSSLMPFDAHSPDGQFQRYGLQLFVKFSKRMESVSLQTSITLDVFTPHEEVIPIYVAGVFAVYAETVIIGTSMVKRETSAPRCSDSNPNFIAISCRSKGPPQSFLDGICMLLRPSETRWHGNSRFYERCGSRILWEYHSARMRMIMMPF